ncbi:MAG: hypothetical protein FJZ47_08890 [Candidatus Tectomicrobia bacterium]|uniref:Uncharacterized protein n=1 Tax=Tectimicrobiota bacterium TaxID=2528274 RepID=A0A938B0L8_UNCTE|nr:hypothetical protein [Candidatus Tectomicrobia bacterium]
MPPFTSLSSWWTAHLQLPDYDPIATAGAYRFDMRAAEQALAFCARVIGRTLSPWEEAIVLNLWGWRRADGQRRYVTVYAEPYRQDALATWCAALALLVLRAAPPRRAPQVVVTYAQAALATDVYTQVVAAREREPDILGALWCDVAHQTVETSRGGKVTLAWSAELCPGEVFLCREDGPALTLAVATRDAEHSPIIAPIATAAQQALAGEGRTVLPALL